MARNANYKGNEDQRQPKAPAYIAYSVADKGEDKSFWSRIGAAWAHEDGKGLSLVLDLIPLNGGRVVLRTPSEANEEKGA